jgi:hypothetical protein
VNQGNTFDVVKYNENFEIWNTLKNMTNSNNFTLSVNVSGDRDRVITIPMTVVGIQEGHNTSNNRYGTSKHTIFYFFCIFNN